jgi:hypothetical protein
MTAIEIIIPIVAGIAAAITHRIGFNNGIKTMEDIVLSADNLNDLKGMIKAKYNCPKQ